MFWFWGHALLLKVAVLFSCFDLTTFFTLLLWEWLFFYLKYWTAPWWLAEGRNSKSPERASLCNHFGVCMSVCLSVCMSVCLWSSYRSQFSTLQPNFLKICSLRLWEKKVFFNFSKFWFLALWGPFFGHFLSIFFFILCKSSVRATSHTDRLTNLIFGTESLYDTITWGFQWFLKICISAPFRGPFIFKKGPKSQKT